MIYIKTTSFLKRFHHSFAAQHASLSHRVYSAAAILALSSAGLLGSQLALAQDRPQSLPAIKLGAGMHVISAEVAQSPEQRATGLMNRPSMGANEGMLFVFEEANPQCFWMKNTLLPLSIAFIADDGTVVNIADMKPQALDSHCSAKPVRYALEMNQGWFAKRGIKTGSKLTGRPWGS
ncbi:DUF192 domain-containing protein [Paucibacter sp. B2R-40]|uniref:DUF192 domain-containing protein n=1 Tax=Paucibacter sp. B2R-40 TaxID=2893554 RepID=UPI0021E3D6B6|nr:DUF192 domain-containing protein [Paucibacter sp. B2R-40]MCV2354152.1 DUF192 domain-containing protein [Paucibacter sp. B2R-40]